MREAAEFHSQTLIPGLPDEIALDCLARVPYRFHSALKSVCRRWNDLLGDSSFYNYRRISGNGEDVACFVQALVSPESVAQTVDSSKIKTVLRSPSPPLYGINVYNVAENAWLRMKPHPEVLPTGIPMFCQCVALNGKLVLVGGWDPSNLESVADIYVYDFVKGGGWRRGAPMSVARSFFACAAVGSTVYVAGGHDNMKNALRSAEAYHVDSDKWRDLPPLADERDECQGLVCNGRFWVLSGYGTDSQGRFGSGAECYDPVSGSWTKLDGVWPFPNASPRGSFHVPRRVKPEILSISGSMKLTFPPFWFLNPNTMGVMEFDEYEKIWKLLGPMPGGICSCPCAVLIEGGPRGDRIFVIGSGQGDGGPYRNRACVLESSSRKWTHINTPLEFSGFAYSCCSFYL